MKRAAIAVPFVIGLIVAGTLIASGDSGRAGSSGLPAKAQPTPTEAGGDSGVVLEPPTGTPAISSGEAIAAVKKEWSGAKHAESFEATLADITEPSAGLDDMLGYDVEIQGVCVPNYGSASGPQCFGYTWHVIVDATTGDVIQSYAVTTTDGIAASP